MLFRTVFVALTIFVVALAGIVGIAINIEGNDYNDAANWSLDVLPWVAPALIMLAVFQWKTKRPEPIGWEHLASATFAALVWAYSVYAQLYFADQSEVILTMVVLPALLVIMSALAIYFAYRWWEGNIRDAGW